MPEQHVRHGRHPAKWAGLKRGQREEVRFGGHDQAILQPKAVHRRDREVLEDDAEHVGENQSSAYPAPGVRPAVVTGARFSR